MFKRLDAPNCKTVTLTVEDRAVEVAGHATVAAALLLSGLGHSRTTPVSQAPRAPYCLMGVCYECLVEIDGVPNVQACMTPVRDGMVVRRQCGPRNTPAKTPESEIEAL